MKEKILFKCYNGSKLFGTDSPNSDIDIEGIFLPDINDLILCKQKDIYDFSTNNKKKNTKEDTDEKYLSLQHYMKLLLTGELNCVDLLFAYTNEKCVLFMDPLWKELIANIDKVISKNIKKYISICNTICIKNNIEPETEKCFENFEKMLSDKLEEYAKLNISTYPTLETLLLEKFSSLNYTENKSDYYKHNTVIGIKYKQNIELFGDKCYIAILDNKEKFFCIDEQKFSMTEGIKNTLYNVKNFSKRKAFDYKKLSLCMRTLVNLENLIKNGKLSFPLKGEDLELVRSIKFKTTNMTLKEICDMIKNKFDYINKDLLPNSKLRDKPDMEWVENFILKCYK